jgi:hypothetical protein
MMLHLAHELEPPANKERFKQRRLTIGLKRTDAFRKDAVRIALSSGFTRRQIAADLGVGMSKVSRH